MKRFALILMAVCFALALCACQEGKVPATETTQTTQSMTLEPTQQTEQPTEAPTEVTETQPPVTTMPAHSLLYLPEVSQEEMIQYFNEVVLSIEYSEGDGDATLVQKWIAPIYYIITGDPTDTDREVMDGLFAQLNEIQGFPGIYPAQDDDQKNLTITFLDHDTFRLAFSDFLRGEEADGAVQFWYYTASNEIHTGRIGYRTDISQEIRNSVILEELVNLLGLNDTVLREDSIIYQYSSEATQLSEIDWILLKLLYSPEILPGMNATDCRTVLEQLYY